MRIEPVFLFDLDGTLVDSVYQHVLAWKQALDAEGIELSVWRIHRKIGMSGGACSPTSCFARPGLKSALNASSGFARAMLPLTGPELANCISCAASTKSEVGAEDKTCWAVQPSARLAFAVPVSG